MSMILQSPTQLTEPAECASTSGKRPSESLGNSERESQMKNSDLRMTPKSVYGPLNWLFDFTLDPCTSEDNPLCAYAFFSEKDDGLSQSWAGQKAFVNPPYSLMIEFARKAVTEATTNRCFVAFILPNDASTEAYQLLEKASWGCWRPPFRVKFLTAFQPKGKQKPLANGLWEVDVARSHVVFFLGGL